MHYQVWNVQYFRILLLKSIELHLATIRFELIERNTLIDCPGDIISYNCSVLLSDNSAELTWTITLPGKIPLNITYDDSSLIDNGTDILGMGVSTLLVDYRRNEYIESVVVLTLMKNVTLNGSIVECSVSNFIDNDPISTLVLVNTSGMDFSPHESCKF